MTCPRPRSKLGKEAKLELTPMCLTPPLKHLSLSLHFVTVYLWSHRYHSCNSKTFSQSQRRLLPLILLTPKGLPTLGTCVWGMQEHTHT